MVEAVEIDVPARNEYLGLVRMMVSTLASSRREIDDDRLDDLTLAVSEACSIAVAADDAPGRRLVVRCTEEPDSFTLDVHDGRERLADPDATPGLPDPHDLDVDDSTPLELIRALVDSLEVIHADDRDILRLRMVCTPSPEFLEG
jgi:anti-sigma regulatory factor (Ser/Thr protein kinase)